MIVHDNHSVLTFTNIFGDRKISNKNGRYWSNLCIFCHVYITLKAWVYHHIQTLFVRHLFKLHT